MLISVICGLVMCVWYCKCNILRMRRTLRGLHQLPRFLVLAQYMCIKIIALCLVCCKLVFFLKILAKNSLISPDRTACGFISKENNMSPVIVACVLAVCLIRVGAVSEPSAENHPTRSPPTPRDICQLPPYNIKNLAR